MGIQRGDELFVVSVAIHTPCLQAALQCLPDRLDTLLGARPSYQKRKSASSAAVLRTRATVHNLPRAWTV